MSNSWLFKKKSAEILAIRKQNKNMQGEILSFFSKLKNYQEEFWNPQELVLEYEKHFHIITQREGKI